MATVWFAISFAAVALLPIGAESLSCSSSNSQFFPFCNVSVPIQDRVQDLISRLTLHEKLEQIVNKVSANPRLGLAPYDWWSEGLHGISDDGTGVTFIGPISKATTFPQVILTAASFNVTLWTKIAQAVSTEGRAMYNNGQAGLTYWAPNINIFRDPRWGRGQETSGEDPFLSSKYAAYYVRGMQDPEEQSEEMHLFNSTTFSKMKVSACCKHFTAYDMESWGGSDRNHFNAEVTLQDLADTYNVPFRSCVEDGHASGVMCSYNRLNGIPTCADYSLLTDTLRNTWGFEGYIVSDCDAVALIFEFYNYTQTPEEAVADVLLAGLDLNCGTSLLRYTEHTIEEGRVTESNIDHALLNLFTVQMRLGMFDGVSNLYGRLGPADVCSEMHQQLSLEAALQGIVLLKNEHGALPLPQEKDKAIVLIGPHVNASRAMLGDYAGKSCKITTPLEGMQKYGPVTFSLGCSNVECKDDNMSMSAVEAAKNADVVVLFMGITIDQETEGKDRMSLLLPGYQQQLVSAVAAAGAASGIVVLVIISGGPIDVSFAKHDPHISSILWVGYPGEAGGEAIARILYGERSPGGRLPVTWYSEDFTKVSMLDMNMRPNISTGYPGRTYRFYTGKAVFDFGDGLSYTNFSYSFMLPPNILYLSRENNHVHLSVGHSLLASVLQLSLLGEIHEVEDVTCDTFKVSISVGNLGNQDADESVLLFVVPPTDNVGQVKKQLVAFERVHIQAGKVVQVTFDINPCTDLAVVDGYGRKVLHSGHHALKVASIEHPLVVMFH